MIEAVVGFVLFVVAGALGGMLYGPLARRHGRRLAEASTYQCGIRVMSGQLPGFTDKWRHGPAKFRHGVIEFEDETIHVTDLDSNARQPTADELWWTSFDNRIVLVAVDTAVVELAVRTPQLDAVRLRLESAPNVTR